MNQEDIDFAKEEIAKHRVDTPYGKGLQLPWSLLKDAVESVEQYKARCEELQDALHELMIKHEVPLSDYYKELLK